MKMVLKKVATTTTTPTSVSNTRLFALTMTVNFVYALCVLYFK